MNSLLKTYTYRNTLALDKCIFFFIKSFVTLKRLYQIHRLNDSSAFFPFKSRAIVPHKSANLDSLTESFLVGLIKLRTCASKISSRMVQITDQKLKGSFLKIFIPQKSVLVYAALIRTSIWDFWKISEKMMEKLFAYVSHWNERSAVKFKIP